MMAKKVKETAEKAVIVRVRDVDFSYGDSRVLSDVSLDIKEGDFLAIIGPNGSGKSTLVKIMLGLIRPDSGKVKLFGKDLSAFDEWWKIGYVPQRIAEIDKNFPASVHEIVSTGLLPAKAFPRFTARADSPRIDEALKAVGMHDKKDKRIGELSGGETQRVFIARALISKPRLIILDEPATGIDKRSQDVFYGMLENLNKEGMTMVMVTHEISFITRLVTKVACLNQKLVFHGSHEEFCSSDLKDMYGMDTHSLSHRH